MSEVISNTSPLQYLHQLELLPLLPRLVGKVLVPPGVKAELEAGRELGIDVPSIESLDWIKVYRPEGRHVAMLVHDLGAGETEAMLLALERPGSIVLLDDKLARRTAEALRLRFTGTLGLLVDAKTAGLVTELRPIVDKLQDLGFRLSSRARDTALRLAHELPWS